ncbi:hypothetical protein ALI144C_01760 [Actinosynnema sp. ALI-1.44]|nr:hypothetical protein ALI144C_01760 [Actinosynnema sp. ALI-1.44]
MNRRLADLPVEKLGSGVPKKFLNDGGVSTAFDVFKLGESRLRELRGIDQWASKLMALVEHERDRVQADDLRPPRDPRDWWESDADLVRALRRLASIGAILGMPELATVREIVSLLRWLKGATRWWRWLFGTMSHKLHTRSRYEEAQRLAHSADVSEQVGRAERVLESARPQFAARMDRAEVEQDWRGNSAELLSLLERLVAENGSPDEQALIRHGRALAHHPSALVEQIERMKLDVRFIRRTLRIYQEFGAKFALVVGRSILGDEMGLGKTIEALAAIAHAVAVEEQRHHIVICPAALVDNWMSEIDATLHDAPGLRGVAFREPGRQNAFEQWRVRGGILVSSYRVLNHLLDGDVPSVGFLVVDEGHFVKNPKTQQSGRTARLSRCAKRALLMSGTPMENHAGDLVQITRVVDEARGDDLDHRFDGGRAAMARSGEFRRVLGEFYLRRNQIEVLDELPTIVGTDHPVKVGGKELDEYEARWNEGKLDQARWGLTIGAGPDSMKLRLLSEIVNECRQEGHKLLVFSQFIEVVIAVQKLIGDECSELRGAVSKEQREDNIELFQAAEGFAALSIQIVTGALGLNLQAASVVVLMEPQYKPSTEWQAVKRAHRMGQAKVVVVHRLVARHPADERIVERTRFKAEQFAELAARSDLADASLDALDNSVNEAQLLAELQAIEQDLQQEGASPQA